MFMKNLSVAGGLLKRRAKTSGVLRDKSGGWALAH
jgi:hypothetical protein